MGGAGRQGGLLLLAGLVVLGVQVDAQGKPSRAHPVPPPPPTAPPPRAPSAPPPPPARTDLAESLGVFQGIPACVEPGSDQARERNCKTEIDVVHVTEGCFEYHAPNVRPTSRAPRAPCQRAHGTDPFSSQVDETGWSAEEVQRYLNLEGSHM